MVATDSVALPEVALRAFGVRAALVPAGLPAASRTPIARFVSRTHDASQVVGYGKTAMVFLMLREEIGDVQVVCDRHEKHACPCAGELKDLLLPLLDSIAIMDASI